MLSFLTALSAVFIISKPSVAVFLSIDCGVSNSSTYKDERSIVWTGDNAYIHSGESQVVQFSSTVPSWMSTQVMSTLRVFPILKKNCYTIPDLDKGQRLLVRATFFYGNYDGKYFAPTFELHFDGNFWATVTTSNSTYVVEEAIYVVKGNATSICLAQTHPDQVPFISALELRSLDSEMYSNVGMNRALLLANRIAYGANQTVRYPDDKYDRIWNTRHGGFTLTQDVIRNEADAIHDVSAGKDHPPLAVLQNAVGTIGTAWGIGIETTGLGSKNVPIFIIAYFSEVVRLNSTQKRSIEIVIDNEQFSSEFSPLLEANLSSFGLSGSLPDFSSMDALQKIDLHNNSLNGPIPDFLGSFPDLLLLNLADNRFNGSVPTSLSENKNLTLVVSGNCFSGMTCKAANAPPLPKQPYEIPPPPTTNSGGQNSGDNKSVDMLQIILGVGVQISLLSLLLRNF
ncbi:probable LRR receptor-like serine/threonine-protein kinase At5g16900 [Juglans microcarpa x Juglans regia]|uniref:probable LRR receptor-like serine/threonine-protein kinase At5g16900 n=1 Tax=Juglans microcarpa x Juglans regia TaxID=2249226 RepID=UPI001B7DCB89|nr:probable LRR receptor-like serine/threonine-protein kinase At5g16900 [Juglans microcarpa x Juglans regia]